MRINQQKCKYIFFYKEYKSESGEKVKEELSKTRYNTFENKKIQF